jgi:hypothetical protein
MMRRCSGRRHGRFEFNASVDHQDDGWTQPVNLGCDINSPDDELAATLIPGTRTLVFPSTRPLDGTPAGTTALWSAELPPGMGPR